MLGRALVTDFGLGAAQHNGCRERVGGGDRFPGCLRLLTLCNRCARSVVAYHGADVRGMDLMAVVRAGCTTGESERAARWIRRCLWVGPDWSQRLTRGAVPIISRLGGAASRHAHSIVAPHNLPGNEVHASS